MFYIVLRSLRDFWGFQCCRCSFISSQTQNRARPFWARLGGRWAGMDGSCIAARCSQRKPTMSCLWSVLNSVPSGVQQRPSPRTLKPLKGWVVLLQTKGWNGSNDRDLSLESNFCKSFGFFGWCPDIQQHPYTQLRQNQRQPLMSPCRRSREQDRKDADDIGRFCEPSHGLELPKFVWFKMI